MIATLAEREGKAGASFCIATIECDRTLGQLFLHSLCFGRVARVEGYARSHERGSKARVAAGKDRIEIDGLLKEFFSNRVIRRVTLAEVPQAPLISPPSVEACRRPLSPRGAS